MIGIEWKASTIYYPQMDGQTECVNQSLEQYLQLFVNYNQDNWEELLPLAEFVYNNMPHVSTNLSPFYATKGFYPQLLVMLTDIPNHTAHLVATNLKDLYRYLKEQVR